jgi:hypothetical protein
MKFLVECKNRLTGGIRYLMAVPEESPDHIPTYDIQMVRSLAEARCHPFPTEDEAACALNVLPKTKNIDYKVIEIEEAFAADA